MGVSDERKNMEILETDLIPLKQLCENISVSLATGKNWLRLGKIEPQYVEGNTPFFSNAYAEKLRKDLQTGKKPELKSRRNKKYISGNALYHSYVSGESFNIEIIRNLLNELIKTGVTLREKELQILLAECALQMCMSVCEKQGPQNGILLKYINGQIEIPKYGRLIDDLLADKNYAHAFIEKYPTFFTFEYTYEKNEDIIGLLYISCRNIAARKATGSYYTPTEIVKHMIDQMCGEDTALKGKKILDPCCGTGNFLLQLPDGFQIENIYGNDIDDISIKVTRINLALKYNPEDISVLYRNITNLNYLCQYDKDNFDYILGNPPWGYEFKEDEKSYLRKNYHSAEGKNIESYDVFIERALLQLKRGGVMSYVLPEAIMNVKAHMPIRKEILEKASIQYLAYLGNAFDKVQCPCIIMQLQNTGEPMNCVGMMVNVGDKKFRIASGRTVDESGFCFQTTDEEQAVLDRILGHKECTYLAENAVFALGIVTGNNKKYITSVKSEKTERILKGSDIYKYRASSSGNYIIFEPERFQQVAPTEYYRAPEKLLYRFISNQLIFSYDDRQTLTLNSCNIVIPRVDELSVKYILTILNSRVAQFIFQKQFHSIKVLRSHIEKIPLPKISKAEQKLYESYAQMLMNETQKDEIQKIYDKLDWEIAKLFDLTKKEYQIILEALEGQNLFLYKRMPEGR